MLLRADRIRHVAALLAAAILGAGISQAQDRPRLLPPTTPYFTPLSAATPSEKTPVRIEPVPVRALTLADLEQMALGGNPTVPAAAALVQQQLGLLRQSTLYPNPTLGYLRTDADRQGQTRTEGVFFSQEIVTAGKLRLAADAGRLEVEHANWQLQAQRSRVVNDVRIRFYETLGAKEAIDSAKELETLANEGVRIAKQLLEGGRGSRPDLLQAEIQRSTVSLALQEAKLRYESAWRQLSHVVGVPELAPSPLEGNLEQDIPRLEWDDARDFLLSNSPLLRAQTAQIQATQAELRLARAQAYPNVSVQVVAQRDSIQNYASVGTLLAVPIPLFNRNQGNVQNVQGQLVQQQREYERLRLALLDQLSVAFRQYLALRHQTDRLRDEILPRSKENLDLTTSAYRQGQFDFPRVLAARQTYFQTRMAYIDSLTELRKSAVEIDGMLLTGGLNPTEVGTALQGSAGATGMRGILMQQSLEQRGSVGRTLPGAVQAIDR